MATASAEDDFEFSDDFGNNGMGSPSSNDNVGGSPTAESGYQHHQQQQQQHSGAPAPFPLSMDALRASIERFLLPRPEVGNTKSTRGLDKAQTPHLKLDDICMRTAVTDHIRSMQTIYRDPNDELNLGKDVRSLYPELNDEKLTSKSLTTKIIDGRCKITALARICNGDESLLMLRSSLDLANAYALQGLWLQVEEHMMFALELVAKLQRNKAILDSLESVQKNSRDAAARIECTYRILREHAAKNRGQVHSKEFMKILIAELGKLSTSWSQENLERGISESLGHPAQLAVNLNAYFNDFAATASGSPTRGKNKLTPSWGDIVNYFRNESPLMNSWVELMEAGIPPQTKAVLLMPFKICDQQSRGVAHPMQLSNYVKNMSSVAKTVAGTGIVKLLTKIKVDVMLLLNSATGALVDIVDRPPPTQSSVSYELPITREEYLAIYTIYNDVHPLDLLKSQILTLTGVCQIFREKLPLAEDTLHTALNHTESIGLGPEISSCEMYNSIAQLMIMKHKQWQIDKKSRHEKEAQLWLESEAGKKQLREIITEVKKSFKHKILCLSHLEAESRAKTIIMKRKLKALMAEEEGDSSMPLEAAYKYLVRAHEILEDCHGSSHATVATACLALASVKNIANDLNMAREWLSKSLRLMEKLETPPYRAIAFIQIQLAQVLFKQNYDAEAVLILTNAFNFHSKKAFEGLSLIGKDVASSQFVVSPLSRTSPVFEDVTLTIELLQKLISTAAKNGDKYKACELSEEGLRLIENSYGWDSIESAEWRKQAGIRSAAIGDWTRSVAHFRKCLEVFELLLGKDSKQYSEVLRLHDHALDKKNRMLVEIVAQQDEEDQKPENQANFNPHSSPNNDNDFAESSF